MLPRVEESDLLNLVIEEVIDPKYLEWWKEFAHDNPLLAKEVIKRAYVDSQNLEATPSLESYKIIINNVLFAIRALKIAAERRSAEITQDKRPAPTDEVA